MSFFFSLKMNNNERVVKNFNFQTPSNLIQNPNNKQIISIIKNDDAFDADLLIHKEFRRRSVLAELHDKYEKKFTSTFYTDTVPKDSLNRFLYEQLSLESRSLEHSCCLKQPENILLMDTLAKEITTAYPLVARANKSILFEMEWFKVKRKIDEYLTLAFVFLKNEQKTDEFKTVRKLINGFGALYDLANYEQINVINKLKERFSNTFNDCFQYFKERCDEKIKQVCEYMIECSRNTSNELIEIASVKEDTVRGKLEVRTTGKSIEMSYQGCSFQIHEMYYEKLRQLYEMNAVQRLRLSFNQEEFETRVFCLICRYESFFKNSLRLNEGYGMQAALPSYAFELIFREFDVTQEMFASPFNCYFSTFCSAFLDTDVYFGSLGSFFDFEPAGGSFECNPPFTEECIERMADRIDILLEANQQHPLSFIVFIPEWIDPPTPGLVKMQKSIFLRETFVLPRGKHSYVSGSQHIEKKFKARNLYFSSHETRVFILQNELGFKKWTPTENKTSNIKQRLIYQERKPVNDSSRLVKRRLQEDNSSYNDNFYTSKKIKKFE